MRHVGTLLFLHCLAAAASRPASVLANTRVRSFSGATHSPDASCGFRPIKQSIAIVPSYLDLPRAHVVRVMRGVCTGQRRWVERVNCRQDARLLSLLPTSHTSPLLLSPLL
jgi:hypothetical protein